MGIFDRIKDKAHEVANRAQPAQQAAPAYEEPAAGFDEDDPTADEDADPFGGYFVTNSDWYERHLRSAFHFGHFDPDDLDRFYFAYFELEEAEGEERLPAEMARYGISSKDEWGLIWASFLRRHFSGLSEQAMQEKFLVTMATARNQQTMLKMQAASAADPSLTEPVEGVTVEGWAQAAVAMANSGGEMAQAARALAPLGMDQARYERVNAEFQARMQRDTSFVIAQIYGKAFSAAQGVQGGYGLGSADGSLQQLGAEPCTFEQYAEISGAMGAWGESGQDVTAMLQHAFNMTAMDLSRFGGYWSTVFAADPNLALRYADLMEQYKQRYRGAGPDSDLSI